MLQKRLTYWLSTHIQLLNTTMAEINARREARRRRILENSENRLRKITGRVNPDEIKGKYNQHVKQKYNQT